MENLVDGVQSYWLQYNKVSRRVKNAAYSGKVRYPDERSSLSFVVRIRSSALGVADSCGVESVRTADPHRRGKERRTAQLVYEYGCQRHYQIRGTLQHEIPRC